MDAQTQQTQAQENLLIADEGINEDAVDLERSPASESNESQDIISSNWGSTTTEEKNPGNEMASVITEDMAKEERQLYEEGVQKEEERQKENKKLLDEVDESVEKRYERLKYLLSKSTLYTEYLVERMRKQKEQNEKTKDRLAKKKSKQQAAKEEEKTMPEAKRRKRVISDSTENPVEKHIDLKAQDVDETEEQECRYINGEEVPSLQPLLMDGGVLRPYQVEGYNWLKVLYENGVNGILADEMGLGKTVQCVAILSHLVQMGVPGPFLVCAPLSTIPNWLAELQRFAPKVPTVLYHGNKDQRASLVRKIKTRYRVPGVDDLVNPVVITSYEIAMIDRRHLANFDWKYLIVDEGHRIKNTHCRLIRELRMYHTTHRLLLTGTPLQNNLAELWSLLNFLLPEIFDDRRSFEMWFDANCINDQSSEEHILKQEQGKNILSILHQILSPFMLRRLKSDVDLCIPPKKEVLVYAPLTSDQREFYSALVDRTIFNFLEDKKENTKEKIELNAAGHPKRRSASRIVDYSLMMESKEKERRVKTPKHWNALAEDEELESWIHAISNNTEVMSRSPSSERQPKSSQVTIQLRNVMMQLRKCCNHLYLLQHPLDKKTGELALTEDVVKSSGKMLVLDQMLKELKKRGHKVLVFSQMTRMLDLIEDLCVLRAYNFCRLDGSTAVNDRRDSMNVFNDAKSDKFIFLLSTRAGGLGINLTGADTVIIYDSDWNPQCDLQAQDRCHRIGQTKPVVVYRFVTANTIDQKIIERAAGKRTLEKMVIHKGKFKSCNFINRAKPITPDELKELLQSKDHTSEVKHEQDVIKPKDLKALLDRSDLYLKWDQSKLDVKNSHSNLEKPKQKRTPCKDSSSSPSSNLFKVIGNEGDSSF